MVKQTCAPIVHHFLGRQRAITEISNQVVSWAILGAKKVHPIERIKTLDLKQPPGVRISFQLNSEILVEVKKKVFLLIFIPIKDLLMVRI